MRTMITRTLTVAAAATLLHGCGKDATPLAVKPVVRAEVTVTLAGPQANPGDPVTLIVRLTNTGSERIEMDGCGNEPVRQALLLDPESQVVYDYWPFPYQSLCPAIWFLKPGETMEWTREFAGQLYSQAGDAYPAPSGTYTLVSTARFSGPTRDTRQTATGSATFAWSPP